MKRLFRAVATIALLVPFSAHPAWTQGEPNLTPEQVAVTTDDGSQLWFAEMSSPPTSDGGDLATILAEQATFRGAASLSGIRYQERKAFKNLWNGLSIAVHPSDIDKLRRVPGATYYPVIAIQAPETTPMNDPELLTAIQMTGADVAQNDLGLTGAGIKVGIIDTGVDYDHPALGGDGVDRSNSTMFPNARVIAGTDYVGDAYTGANTPVPDPYPDDCFGHGTHVAGIVGANGLVKGVAPGVTFGVYRVFGCAGSTQADIMIAAMEQALDDGMQIVNMSIGASTQWPSYPTGAASDRLVQKGVVVVASIGNAGQGQPACCLYAASAPGVGKKVIGVASFDNTHTNQFAFTATPDNQAFGFNGATGAPGPPASGTYPLARTGTSASTADACVALPAGSLTGKVALIRRGTCSFYAKSLNAQNAGAIAVVLYNNVAGALNPTVVPPLPTDPPITIPVVAITAAAGVTLDARLASGPVDITWGASVSTPNANGGFISSFSSIGLAPDLSLKPNLGAPGGFILSTVPLNTGGGYGQNSGTSMASPHVAGAAALVLEAKPNTSPTAIRTMFENNANPRPRSPFFANLDMVQRQGAGLLDIPNALMATTRVEPEGLALGETEGNSVTKSLTITNKGSASVSYSLTHQPALASSPGTFTFPGGTIGSSTVSFSANPVIVPAGGSASVDVTVTANAGLADRSMFGGYVVVTPDDAGQDVRVPFAGFKGDYQSLQIFVPTGNNFPRLGKQVAPGSFQIPVGPLTYTLQGLDQVFVLVHLEHQSARLRMEVLDATTGQSWHRALDEKDVGRNTSAGGFFALSWDGITVNGNQAVVVPNGSYVIKLSALKALGDGNNPAHWETWTSPVVTLARPDLAVERISVSQGVVNAGDQVTVSATLKNQGGDPQPGVHVEFFDNDVLLGGADVDLAGGETQTVSSPWTVGDVPQHRLKVKVTPLEVEESLVNNETILDLNLGEAIVGVGGPTPRVLSFAPAKPNPSKGDVAFRFTLPTEGPVELSVFDLAGRRLKSWQWNSLPPGDHSVAWNGRTDSGRQAPAGALLLRLNAMGRTLTQKAVRIN